METIEQVNDNFEVKKSKKKGLIIAGIIAAVLIIALVLAYFLVFSKPEFIFSKAIDKLFKVETEEVNSVKFDSKIKATLETEDENMKPIFDEISKCTLKLGAQLDAEEKKEIVNLGLEYTKDSVIDAQVYYNDGDLYAYFEGLFKKYIEIDMSDMDKESKDALDSIFESLENKDEQAKKTEKAIKILRDELKKQIKEEGTFEKEKETIDIGDKENKVNKYTLTLSTKQLCKVISNVCSDLAENEKFLECFEDDIEDYLNEISKGMKDLDTDNKSNVKISIYTKGIFNEVVGVNFEIYVQEENTTLQVLVLKENKNTYTFKLGGKSKGVKMDLIDGTIKIEKEKNSKNEQKGKITITINMSEFIADAKGKIEIDYSAELNKGVDKIDTSNSVKIEEITEEDALEILEKLKERPLIGEAIENALNIQNQLYDRANEAAEKSKEMMELEEQFASGINNYIYDDYDFDDNDYDFDIDDDEFDYDYDDLYDF